MATRRVSDGWIVGYQASLTRRTH